MPSNHSDSSRLPDVLALAFGCRITKVVAGPFGKFVKARYHVRMLLRYVYRLADIGFEIEE